MSSSDKISVFIPFLGKYKDICKTIENCSVVEKIQNIIIYGINGDCKNYSEILNKFSKNKKIIFFKNDECTSSEILNNLLYKFNTSFISFIRPGERYIKASFDKKISILLSDKKIKIISCNCILTDSNYNFNSISPSINPKLGFKNFEDGLLLSSSGMFINREYMTNLNISLFDINYLKMVDIFLKVLRDNANSIINIDKNIIQIPKKSSFINTSIYESSWELVTQLANILLKNGSTNLDEYTKFISREIFYLYKLNSIKMFSKLSRKFRPYEELSNQIYKNLNSFIFDFQKKEDLKIDGMPNELSLFIDTRPDLKALNFHKKDNEKEFCRWIVKYGFREERNFFYGNSDNKILEWLSNSSSGEKGDLSRISNAILESSRILKYFWRAPIHKQKFEIFLKVFWNLIPLKLPPKKYFFKREKYKKSISVRIYELINYFFPSKERNLKQGVNLIGYAKHSLGIGEDLRTTLFALEKVQIKTSIINFNPGSCKDRFDKSLKGRIKTKAPFNTTIICLTAEETLRFIRKKSKKYLNKRYVIGYWPWELPNWPRTWIRAIDFVDEIWVSTNFIKNSLHNCTTKPIKVMPLCVDRKETINNSKFIEKSSSKKTYFGLENEINYIITGFDLNSYIERKNPFGALTCFHKAFPPLNGPLYNNNVGLIVKTYPSTYLDRRWELFKYITSIDKRIIIIEENFSKQKILDLFGCCDVYLSTHRSEGFGRFLAESFQLGLDVLATNWSGNTDYCEGPLYHPIPYKIQEVKPGDYPHWPNQYWANPDLDVAAKKLYAIIKNRNSRKNENWNYSNKFSAFNCGINYKSRLKEIGLIN